MPSTTVAAGLLVLGLLIGAGITYVAAPSIVGTSTTTVTSGTGGGTTVTSTITNTILSTIATAQGSALAQCGCTITLGDVYDATGSQAPYGAQNKVAIDKAVTDINAWLKTIGDTVQFAVTHEDDQTDPSVALQKLQTLASLGVKVTIGPYFSGAASNMLAYAQANQIVMVSPQATSPTFDTAAHPYLFLVAPTDDQGAKGLAALAIEQGAKAAVVIYRQDTWGTPYSQFFNSSFYALGGQSVTLIPYTPITSGSYDFTAQLTSAQNSLQTLQSKYGTGKVFIINPGFDEDSTLYEQAATSFPALLNATWENTDEVTGFLTTDGATAVTHTVLADVFQPASSTKLADFLQYMGSQIGTAAPEPYATTSYDAVWLSALTILTVGSYNGALVNAALPSVAANYFGVSGPTPMNQYGDRINTDYGIWQVTGTTSAPVWTQIGTYAASGTLTFSQQP
jgi:branched-chain amino acid transport system substrate-binding protein